MSAGDVALVLAALADAWDKGYAAGKDDAEHDRFLGCAVNPYRPSATSPGGEDCPDLWPNGAHLDPPTNCCTCPTPPGGQS